MHTTGVVNRSERHTRRQKSHILTQTHTHTHVASEHQKCLLDVAMHCNPFDLLGQEQCLYIVGLQSLPPTHKVYNRWTLLSMGFMFRIEYHRTLANGCFENLSITVWTWSDGFHIQL